MTASTKLAVFVAATILCAISPIEGFVLKNRPPRSSSVPTRARLAASPSPPPSNAEELFSSDGWPPIKKELDSLPVFCVANEQGQPLQYDVNGSLIPFFYTDVDAARDELSNARAETKLPGLDIIPFPLGAAFQLSATDKAMIIPSQAAVLKAGAPPGAKPLGQQIPLFACMDIMQEKADGSAALPLFMVYEEAESAMRMALDADGGDPADFEIVTLSLQRAVELLATVPDTPAFQFLPPMSSLKHIQEYLDDPAIDD